MELSKRQICLLRLLLQEKEFQPLRYYAKHLGVTSRTLQNDIRKIAGYLEQCSHTLETKTGSGVRLTMDESDREALAQRLSQSDITPGLDGRRIEILYGLLVEPLRNVSIEKLSRKFLVSKTSIVNDLRYIDRWLSGYALTLTKDSSGTRVTGDEDGFRRAYAALIEQYGIPQPEYPRISGLPDLFSIKDIAFMEGLLAELEATYDVHIDEPFYTNLLTHLLICVDRIAKGRSIEAPTDAVLQPYSRMLYRQAANLTDQIGRHFQIRFSDQEVYYVYKYLASSTIRVSEEDEVIAESAQGEADLAQMLTADIKRFIARATATGHLDGRRMADDLLLYIRPMLNRIRYNIHIKSDLADEVGKHYPQTQSLITAALWLLGKKYRLAEIDGNEIAFIVMYCQAVVEQSCSVPRVIVVCQSGYGTSRLLQGRLKKAFPDWEIDRVVSARQLEGMDTADYDFAISTVDLGQASLPHIVISALLTDQDIEKIKSLRPGFRTGSGQGGRIIGKWAASGMLHATASREIWESWLYGGDPDNTFHTACGSLHLTVRLNSETAVFLYFETGASTPVALLQADQADAALALLADYNLLRSHGNWAMIAQHIAGKDNMRMLLRPRLIVTGASPANKREALALLADRLRQAHLIADAGAFLADVLAREAKGSTYVGEDVALPHGSTCQVERLVLSVAVLTEPVLWEKEGQVEYYAKILVLFALPADMGQQNETYVQALQSICDFMDCATNRQLLYSAQSGDEAYNILTGLRPGQAEEER